MPDVPVRTRRYQFEAFLGGNRLAPVDVIVRWVCDAIDPGLPREDSLAESAERVRNLKRLFAA